MKFIIGSLVIFFSLGTFAQEPNTGTMEPEHMVLVDGKPNAPVKVAGLKEKKSSKKKKKSTKKNKKTAKKKKNKKSKKS